MKWLEQDVFMHLCTYVFNIQNKKRIKYSKKNVFTFTFYIICLTIPEKITKNTCESFTKLAYVFIYFNKTFFKI